MKPLESIRKNRNGFVGAWIAGIIGILVVVLVSVALLSPIQTGVDDAKANVTSSAADALLDLIPLLVVVALVLLVVFWAIARYRNM